MALFGDYSLINLLLTLLSWISPFQIGGELEEILINHYETVIADGIRNFENYTDPIDASQYQGNYYQENIEAKDYGTYDFVVIGAGSSGAVLASRLSEVPHWRILLLEAGEAENDFTDIPGLYFYPRFSSYNWGFMSVPQEGACQGMIDKRCPFPRGRGLGGSSIINGMIYARGSPYDFDQWNTTITNASWSYEDVLPYFKKSEQTHIPNMDPIYHGFTGPLPINYHVPTSPQAQAFLDSYQSLGINITDINGAHQLGASLNQLIIDRGRRVTTAKAYLTGQWRPNLDIFTGAYVTRILTKSKTAYGVEFTLNGLKSNVTVSKEVLLSAGVFGSPSILMHSGIGPASELHRNGIKSIHNLANIGENLQDHPTFYGLTFTGNFTESIRSTRRYISEFLQARGPYTIAGNLQAISYHRTKLAQTEAPDIEILLVPSNCTNPTTQKSFHLTNVTYETYWGKVNPTNCFLFYVILLKPRASGKISLKSSNVFDYPLIDPLFLTDKDDYDLETLYLGVQHVLNLIEQEPFRRINASLVKYTFPACKDTKYFSKDYWYCTIRQMTMNLYHPIGTCAMKDKKLGGVVDGEFRIYGVQKLRVVDASVIPFSLSGHPHAAAIMIAEKAADIIKKQYGII